MSLRPLIFAVPAPAIFSLVAAAGLAWTSPAAALDSGSDDPFELAQATPPAAPPPAAGGQDRRDRAGFNPTSVCPAPTAPPAGTGTYLETRPGLTPAQMPACDALPREARR